MPNDSDESDEFLEQLKNFRSNDEEKEVSVLFVNLYGAERLTQQMEVETRVELFNHYFQVMVETVFEHQGTVDKYIGSTIMVVFNSLPLEDHPLMAIKTALAMRERLPE